MITKYIASFLLCFALLSAIAQDKAPIIVTPVTGDSVVTYASRLYKPNSFLRRVFMGSNYRDAWTEPVTLPVFYFSKSGYSIKELGGGMQTKSLHVVDNEGKAWSLRTIDKDVSAALPPGLLRTLTLKASQDFISSSFPYAAPVAGELVNAVGIKVAKPWIVFVADDTALGSFRSIFANTVCMIEEREPGFDSTDDINTTFANVQQSSVYKIQQQVLLKARLMDMLMADWDRHADNWRWGLQDSAGFKYYYAIPRDRDWVFYKSNGIVPYLVKISGGMRCFVSFKPEVKNIKNQSWKAWTMDKNYLNELDAAAWETGIKEVRSLLTDSVITTAVGKIPPSILAKYGKEFITILKSRRDGLEKEVMKYYRFLSEEVIINGSNEDEVFSVTSTGDHLLVIVYRKGISRQKIYERKFSPSETYFVKLNGLGGNDVFEIDENAKSKIRLVINGGEGDNRYSDKGKVRTKVHDVKMVNHAAENYGQANIHLN